MDVTVTQEGSGTYVRADSSIFDLSVVRNRTKSWVLYWWRLRYFSLMKNLPLVDLRYEVSFEGNKVLRYVFDRLSTCVVLLFELPDTALGWGGGCLDCGFVDGRESATRVLESYALLIAKLASISTFMMNFGGNCLF